MSFLDFPGGLTPGWRGVHPANRVGRLARRYRPIRRVERRRPIRRAAR